MDTIKTVKINFTVRKGLAVATFLFGFCFLIAGFSNPTSLGEVSKLISFGFFGAGIGILLSLTNKIDLFDTSKP